MHPKKNLSVKFTIQLCSCRAESGFWDALRIRLSHTCWGTAGLGCSYCQPSQEWELLLGTQLLLSCWPLLPVCFLLPGKARPAMVPSCSQRFLGSLVGLRWFAIQADTQPYATCLILLLPPYIHVSKKWSSSFCLPSFFGVSSLARDLYHLFICKNHHCG